MNGIKVGERLQMNNVVSFQCEPGYTLQVIFPELTFYCYETQPFTPLVKIISLSLDHPFGQSDLVSSSEHF